MESGLSSSTMYMNHFLRPATTTSPDEAAPHSTSRLSSYLPDRTCLFGGTNTLIHLPPPYTIQPQKQNAPERAVSVLCSSLPTPLEMLRCSAQPIMVGYHTPARELVKPCARVHAGPSLSPCPSNDDRRLPLFFGISGIGRRGQY